MVVISYRIRVTLRLLAERFRTLVLKMLKDKERLDDTLIKKIRIFLNKIGMDFINLSTTGGDKTGCINIAIRILQESQRTMAGIQQMRVDT